MYHLNDEDREVSVIEDFNRVSAQWIVQFSSVQFSYRIYVSRSLIIKTRKLGYRKNDRAMRPIYGCPETFRALSTPTATFAEIFNGFCSDRSYECACKS